MEHCWTSVKKDKKYSLWFRGEAEYFKKWNVLKRKGVKSLLVVIWCIFAPFVILKKMRTWRGESSTQWIGIYITILMPIFIKLLQKNPLFFYFQGILKKKIRNSYEDKLMKIIFLMCQEKNLNKKNIPVVSIKIKGIH